MLSGLPILSLLIWLPVFAGILILATGADYNATRARVIALVAALVCIGLTVPLVLGFDLAASGMQFRETYQWVADYNIFYDIGVDGIALALVLLTVFTTLIVVLASWQSVQEKVSQYLAAFLIMQGMMIGVFFAMDAVLFYVFWEAMLIPMYLCIGIWGSSNRVYASIKFFLYTFLGSALMLVALLYLHFKTGSFAIADFQQYKMPLGVQYWIFFAFLLAFGVKVPMWPVHTWLPDAHTEAPAGGSVVLAAVMLKMGVYGFLRFSLPITPDACHHLMWFIIALSLIAVVYIGFVAIVQTDMKKLIAYSSISHMGFVTLGCFIVFLIMDKTGGTGDAYLAIEGGMVQMISHGFSSGAMFLGVGVLYDRLHTRMIGDFGGVAAKMPLFAALFVFIAMANCGLPGTSGFVGEFMVILASFKANFWIAFLAAMTLVLGAAYTLWMVKRVFFGPINNDAVASLEDLYGTETLVFMLLAAVILFLGLYPEPLLKLMHPSVQHLLEQGIQSKI